MHVDFATIQQASSCEGPTYQQGGSPAVAEPGGSSQRCGKAIRLFQVIRARGSGPPAAVLPVQPQQSCCCPCTAQSIPAAPGQLQQTAGRPLRSSSRSASQACALLLGEMCNTQSNFPFSSQNAPYVRTAIRLPRAVSQPEAMVRHQLTVAVPKPSSSLVLPL